MKKWSSFFVFFYGRQSVCFSSHVYGVESLYVPRLSAHLFSDFPRFGAFAVSSLWLLESTSITMSLMVLLMFLLNNNYFIKLIRCPFICFLAIFYLFRFSVLKIVRAVCYANHYFKLSIFLLILSIKYCPSDKFHFIFCLNFRIIILLLNLSS